MRTDNALNDHLSRKRAIVVSKEVALVYDVTTDEMVTPAVLAERQKERAEAAQRVRTGTMG